MLLTREHLTSLHIVDQLFLCLRCCNGSLRFLKGSGTSGGLLNWCTTSVLGGFILEHLTDGNGSAFVTKGEATELRYLVELLKSNRNTGLNAADNLREATRILWLLLLNDITLFILLIRDKDLLDCGLISDCVNMKNTLITLGEDRLVRDEFLDINFSLKELTNWNVRLITAANNIALVDSFLIVNIKAQLDILARLCVSNALIFRIIDSVHLARNA